MSTPTAPSTSNAWTWSFPGAPISVKVDFEFISLLRAQITPGAEVGGVLLGCMGQTPDMLEIRDIAWIPSTSPDQYDLDLSRVEELRKENGARLSVVGFFRTQAQGILELREKEVDLVMKDFSHPNDVVLLIRTAPPQNTAGFFVWYGDVFTPYSFKDFPFDVASLKNDAPVPAAKPAPVVKARAPEPEHQPVPEVWTPPEPARAKTKQIRPRRILPAIAASLVLAAGASGYLLRNRIFPPPAPSAAEPVAKASLKLQVEDQGNGFNIRWDPESTPANRVREGHLVITERDQPPLVVNLDPEQLGSGHVYYRPGTERVSFQLDVTDQAGQTLKDSVLALSTSPLGVRPPEPVAPAPVAAVKPTAPRAGRVVILPRQFALPATSAARVEPQRTILLDQPAVPVNPAAIASGPSLVETSSAIAGRVLPPAPATAPVTPSPVPAAAIESPQPAIATKRVSPTLARSLAALIPGNKELTVSINVQLDETGRVVRAEAVQHDAAVPPRLIKDAVDAALQWQFKPAHRGNTPIASEYTIRFGFQK